MRPSLGLRLNRHILFVWLLFVTLCALAAPRMQAQAPVNDAFANSSVLTGVSVTGSGSNIDATTETGEPAHASGVGGKSVWWQWTAPQSGRVNLDTFGSEFDTLLAVYRGSTVSGLTMVAASDEAGGTHQSAVAFYATAGATYYFAIDGWQGASGAITLRLTSTTSADIYATDFESFTVGSDAIIGVDGWSSSNFGAGASGIVQSAFFGSRAAYVGFNPTTDPLVSVWRSIGYVPTAGATREIEFNVDLAVIDSTTANGKRDAFFVILYNTSGQLLAALNFDNASQRVYRYDGVTYRDVGGFVRGTRYSLSASLNFGSGTWSAKLGSTTLFSSQQINAQSRLLSLGHISATWVIATAGSPGDNYLLFDNFRLWVAKLPVAPTIATQPANRTVFQNSPAVFFLQASGYPDLGYQWEVSSDNGVTWRAIGTDGNYSGQLSAVLTVISASITTPPAMYRCQINNGVGVPVVSSAATLTVNPLAGISAVAAGSGHSLFVRMDGSLWAMGDNASGQLGDGTSTLRLAPVPIDSDVVTVAAGGFHSLYLKTDGTMWGMGQNGYGNLGDGTTTQRYAPVQIAAGVAAIAAGSAHTLFLKTDGTLWACGRNSDGQLGNGTRSLIQATPVLVATGVIELAAGGSHSHFIKSDRTLWGMGMNVNGQLGDGISTDGLRPVQVASSVAAVSGGLSHTHFVKTDGSLWGMGSNNSGQLGDGSTTSRSYPVPITTGVVAVFDGGGHTLFIDNNGSLRGMGSNSKHQLVGGSTAPLTSSVSIFSGVQLAAAGVGHSLFVTPAGSLFSFGDNTLGQLGDGSQSERLAPYQVAGGIARVPGGPTALVAVDAGALGVRLAWSPAVGASHYELWRSSVDSSAAATRVASGVVPAMFFDDRALAGATYHYWIKAVNPAGTGPFGVGANVTPLAVAPLLVASPPNQTANAETPVTLSVNVASNAPLTYQWRKAGQALAGATNATLQFPRIQPSDAGSYDVVVSNAAGSVTSAPALLVVNDVARFATRPGSRALTAGATVALTVDALGAAPLTVQWKRNGQVISGATGLTLNFAPIALADRGHYEVTVSNAFGSAWTTFRLEVGPLNGAVVAWGNNQFGQTLLPSLPNDVVAIAAGVYHGLALRSGGTVAAWGGPVSAAPPDGLGQVVAVAKGTSHAVALSSAGLVTVWGDNSYGQLAVPVGLTSVVAIAAGGDHSLALRSDGSLAAWGNNSSGQCNIPTTLGRVVAVAAAGQVSLALKADGKVAAWGSNFFSATDVPADLGAVKAIAFGGTPLALQSDGTLVAWGANSSVFEVNSRSSNRLPDVSAMSAGGNHGLAIKTDGSLVTFGFGGSGETTIPPGLPNPAAVAAGNGFSLALVEVTAAPSLLSSPVVRTAPAGAATQLMCSAAGYGLSYRWQRLLSGASTWLDLAEGPLVAGVTTATLTLRTTSLAQSGEQFRCVVSNVLGTVTSAPCALTVNLSPVVAVSGGNGYTLVLQADGALWGTGNNTSGQLGDGTLISRSVFSMVGTNVAAMSAGIAHSVFLKTDGSAWSVGLNESGQLGDGSTTRRTTAVAFSSQVRAVAAGGYHTLILKNDGSVWAVGHNDEGQLGDGTTDNRATPVQVATGVAKIAAGQRHSLLLKTDGTLWGVGLNLYGQLGDGTLVRRLNPVLIASNVSVMSAGGHQTLFVKTDGALFGTGLNDRGQLGDGTTTRRSVPVPIATGVAHVSSGESHSLFITVTGELRGMGYNAFGETGDGTTTQRLTPVAVTSPVVNCGVGQVTGFYLKADGSLWGVGRNLQGDLGDGTFINRPIPVQLTTGVAPVAPTNVAASDGSFTDKVRVTWSPLLAASGYEVWRNTLNSTGTATRLASSVIGSPFDDTSALPSTPYFYWIKATNEAGASGFGPGDAGYVGQPVAPALGGVVPVGQVLSAGAPLTLAVEATGTPAPAYQWRRNGVDIPGATNATFTRLDAQLADSGSYVVVVANPVGSVTSKPVTISVVPLGMSAQHVVQQSGYVAGGSVTIRGTLDYSGVITELKWQVLLPPSWALASSVGDAGATKSVVGTTDLVEWTWAVPPVAPFTFYYTFSVPAGTSGAVPLIATATAVQSSVTIPLLVRPDPLVLVAAATRHSADTNGDGRVGLFELTRVIELYNVRSATTRTGRYLVASAPTEDGFAADALSAGDAPVALAHFHSADTNRDARLSLVELTRVIELFNTRTGTTRTGAYHIATTTTEDGFAPGP